MQPDRCVADRHAFPAPLFATEATSLVRVDPDL